jgi:FG-GAP-like repeat/Secretion system C-terminal sorting domain
MSYRPSLIFLLSVFTATTCIAQIEWTTHVLDESINGPYRMEIVDFDLDGDFDFVSSAAQDGGLNWWEQISDGSFLQHVVTPSYNYVHTASADYDQDGDIDIVAASYSFDNLFLYENTGDEFIPIILDETADGAFDVNAVDMDQDSDLDLLVVNSEADEVVWYENQDGVWIEHLIYYLQWSSPARSCALDFDQDGDLDVATSFWSEETILLSQNLGDGLEWQHVTLVQNYEFAYDLVPVDFNDDGLVDLLTSSYGNNSVDLFLQTDEGYEVQHLLDVVDVRPILVADINNDGHDDIVTGSPTVGVSWWSLVGDTWIEHPINPDVLPLGSLMVADLGRDGDLDVAVPGYISDILVWYEQAGSPYPVSLDITPTTPPLQIPAGGGSFSYSALLVNTVGSSFAAQHSTYVELPNGNLYGPIESQNFTITPYMEIFIPQMTVSVPAMAPAGHYRFITEVESLQFSLQDHFPFYKQTGAATDHEMDTWDHSGWLIASEGSGSLSTMPAGFDFNAPTPNPFNSTTRVTVALSDHSKLTVNVFNVAGQHVATLASGSFPAGEHTFTFQAQSLAGGIYFVHADVPGQPQAVQKVVYLK